MAKEYIEREAIEKFITDGLKNPDKSKAFGFDAVEIMAELYVMPNADVVEVVRCKYCEKWNEKSGLCSRYSHDVENVRILQYTRPTDFCSYGVRKVK